MTDNTQPEALRLAKQYDYGDPVAHSNMWKAAVCTELRRQHARIAELEAQLEAVGAGGVQALSAAPVTPNGDKLRRIANLVRTSASDGASPTEYVLAGWKAAMLAASPTPPAKQQVITPETGNSVSAQGAAITSESGAVYAELPDFDSGDEPIWEAVFNWKAATPGSDAHKKADAVSGAVINALRDFADRTHALRMEQAAPKAAPVKACVCGEPQASGTVHRVDGPCYVAAPQQEAQEPCGWDGAEEWEKLAWHLCAEENGEDACNELIWEGGPMPEPWGDRWLKYEGEARRMIALVRTHVPAPQPAPAPLSEREAFEAKFGVPGGVHWDVDGYVVKDNYLDSYLCDRFVGQWKAWQARAALAAQGDK